MSDGADYWSLLVVTWLALTPFLITVIMLARYLPGKVLASQLAHFFEKAVYVFSLDDSVPTFTRSELPDELGELFAQVVQVLTDVELGVRRHVLRHIRKLLLVDVFEEF